MNGTVQKKFTSKKGTPCLEIGGQVYIAPKVDITNVQVGDKLEFQGHSFGDGKMWELDSFRVSELASMAGRGSSNGSPAQSQLPPGPIHEARGLTEAERIFAYGVVTEAIKAGLIMEPEQIEKWVCAGKNALRSQTE